MPDGQGLDYCNKINLWYKCALRIMMDQSLKHFNSIFNFIVLAHNSNGSKLSLYFSWSSDFSSLASYVIPTVKQTTGAKRLLSLYIQWLSLSVKVKIDYEIGKRITWIGFMKSFLAYEPTTYVIMRLHYTNILLSIFVKIIQMHILSGIFFLIPDII